MHAFGLHPLQNHSHRGHEDVAGGIQGIVIIWRIMTKKVGTKVCLIRNKY